MRVIVTVRMKSADVALCTKSKDPGGCAFSSRKGSFDEARQVTPNLVLGFFGGLRLNSNDDE